jgi:hypothetical protein
MKLQAYQTPWAPGLWRNARVWGDELRSQADVPSARKGPRHSVPVRRTASGSLADSLRVVRILAFCQAIIFLVLFLFICAWAQASTTRQPTIDLSVMASSYAPQKERNPFESGLAESTSGSGKTSPIVVSGMLKLKGILYDPIRPSAVVNGQLVTLNKPVKVPTEQGDTEVKAVEITRELVVLEVGDQKVELRLSGREPDKEGK